MNAAVSNHIALFQILEVLTKSNRIHDAFHKIKKDRDAYFDAKRSAAETVLLNELKKLNAAKNIQLRKTLIIEKRLSNLEKAFDAFVEINEIDKFNYVELGVEKTPTFEEANKIVEELVEEEVQTLDKRLEDGEFVIETEEQLIQELYGKVGVPNPDESVVIEEEIELTDYQKAAKRRREDIAREANQVRHSFDLQDEAWNYKNYLGFIEQFNSRSETEVCEPTSQDKFFDRYGKLWTPNMTKVQDFDVPRSKTRNSKPRNWEPRVDAEAAQYERLSKRIKLATIKEEPLKEDLNASTDSADTLNSYSEFKEESDVSSEGSSFYLSEEPSTSKAARQKAMKKVRIPRNQINFKDAKASKIPKPKRSANPKPKAAANKPQPKKPTNKRKYTLEDNDAPPEKKPKHAFSVSGKEMKIPKKKPTKK